MVNTNEKFKELLTYVVSKFNNGDLSETKLWKLLYFCEADFFEKYNKNITKVEFFKNHFGPTPSYNIASKIVQELEQDGYIKRNKKNGGVYYDFGIDYPIVKLSGSEVDSIANTCEKYYRLNREQIVKLAHSDPPYLGANKEGKIDFSFVAYRDDMSDIDENNFNKENYEGEIEVSAARKLMDYVSQRA